MLDDNKVNKMQNHVKQGNIINRTMITFAELHLVSIMKVIHSLYYLEDICKPKKIKKNRILLKRRVFKCNNILRELPILRL